tara:strand:+ start:107 stop:664 length:558 start_codon:yes stop_codon:yes gene_type:complete
VSSEINKLACAVLTAFLVYLMSSFIRELVYHPEKTKEISYLVIPEKEETNIKDIDKKKNEEKVQDLLSESDILKMIELADSEEGKKFASKNCGACHLFTMPPENKIGPSLALLLNRKIGGAEGYKYSKAFKEKGGIWSIKNLYYFLDNPKVWVPGTKMSYRGIKNSEDLINIIKFFTINDKRNKS